MVIKSFPDVELADDYGLLAVGGDFELASLLLAYRSGIFPWPFSQEFPAWFAPPKRALLFVDEFHASKSLQKEFKRPCYTFAIDKNFEAVITNCAESKKRRGQKGTWITEALIQAYLEFHAAGFVHSIECYKEERLIGGLYGVSIGAMFAGESMFYLEPNGSKLAMMYLVNLLKEHGVKWIDCQVQTPFLKSLGAREIERADFMKLLTQSLSTKVKIFAD